jgi:hypothetical protein
VADSSLAAIASLAYFILLTFLGHLAKKRKERQKWKAVLNSIIKDFSCGQQYVQEFMSRVETIKSASKSTTQL